MINIEIKSLKKLEKHFKLFADVLPTIAMRTINRTAPQYQNKAISTIGKIYSYPLDRLKNPSKYSGEDRVSLVPATVRNLSACLKITSRPQNLIEFSKGTGLSWQSARSAAQTKKGVRVKVMKSSRAGVIAHAFISPGDTSKKALIYWRVKGTATRATGWKRQVRGNKGKGKLKYKLGTTSLVPRYPIKALSGPSITQMFNHPTVKKTASDYYEVQFEKNLTHSEKALGLHKK